MAQLTLGLIQLDPHEDKRANVDLAIEFIGQAAVAGAQLVALPETFHCRGTNEVKFATAEPIPGPFQRSSAK